MKIFLISLISLNCFAGFPLVKFEDLYGEFEANQGRAYAKSAKYDLQQVKIAHKEIEVQLNRKEKHLVIKDQSTTVELIFDFSFLNIFKSFAFDGVSAESNERKFNLDIENLDLNIEPRHYKTSNVLMSTDLTAINSDELPSGDIDILDGFVLNGKLSFKKLVFGKVSSGYIAQNLIAENPSHAQEIQESLNGNKKIPLVLRNLNLSVHKGKIVGKILLDSWLNANLYIGADIIHKKKQNMLEITLKKAKLGILSVKRFVLKEIRELKVDAITVKGNTILVDMGRVVSSSSLP